MVVMQYKCIYQAALCIYTQSVTECQRISIDKNLTTEIGIPYCFICWKLYNPVDKRNVFLHISVRLCGSVCLWIRNQFITATKDMAGQNFYLKPPKMFRVIRLVQTPG